MPSSKNLKQYQAALSEAFPGLNISSFDYLNEGWDSLVCLVNGSLIFRFPKRPEVKAALLKEVCLLPRLGPTLPLATPAFSYINLNYGKKLASAFTGYEMIPGQPLGDCLPEVSGAGWWKPPLGQFLASLHSFPLEEARGL